MVQKWNVYKKQLMEGYKALNGSTSILDTSWTKNVEKILHIMGENPSDDLINEYFSSNFNDFIKKYAASKN